MVLAEGKHGNAGGQGSVGVWNAHAWPLWDTIVEGSCRAGSRLNSLRRCPDGLEFTPVGDEEDRVQESQFKAGGLAGRALQQEQGHTEEGRGLGNLLNSCIGEGNGNPLQCSYLENPRDDGAWWAAVYGVAQSRTRLKRLSIA